ncbi:jg27919 [Pararge aegeria aegeria]|uniref:Jg27919 protein n=1 Tax=Pararge aegeria aegeria TaxID=348720 RepID=A0A8S4R472_9NEOP|nr:jg27919 [Pararge aegeria aegeria]
MRKAEDRVWWRALGKAYVQQWTLRGFFSDEDEDEFIMEANQTPTHVMLECTGVTEQREIYLGSPATIPEVLSNLGGMLGLWNELGWLE